MINEPCGHARFYCKITGCFEPTVGCPTCKGIQQGRAESKVDSSSSLPQNCKHMETCESCREQAKLLHPDIYEAGKQQGKAEAVKVQLNQLSASFEAGFSEALQAVEKIIRERNEYGKTWNDEYEIGGISELAFMLHKIQSLKKGDAK